jgi:hypothetical protein
MAIVEHIGEKMMGMNLTSLWEETIAQLEPGVRLAERQGYDLTTMSQISMAISFKRIADALTKDIELATNGTSSEHDASETEHQ